MRLLPKLGPLRPCQVLRGLGLRLRQPRLKLCKVNRPCRSRHLLPPNRKHPRRFPHRAEARAQLLAQMPTTESALFREKFATGAADTLLGKTMIHAFRSYA